MAASNDLQEFLKPFHLRASEAEDRLARLEAAFADKIESGNEELLKKVGEVQLDLEDAKAEREKALKQVQQLSADNAKLQYRITHLVRALHEADSRLASK